MSQTLTLILDVGVCWLRKKILNPDHEWVNRTHPKTTPCHAHTHTYTHAYTHTHTHTVPLALTFADRTSCRPTLSESGVEFWREGLSFLGKNANTQDRLRQIKFKISVLCCYAGSHEHKLLVQLWSELYKKLELASSFSGWTGTMCSW
jgi:hypothetical protein